MLRALVLAVLVTLLSPLEARATSRLDSAGVGPGLGVRLSDGRDLGASSRPATTRLYVGWALADGPPADAPTRFGVAPLALRVAPWLEARVAELAFVQTAGIDARSVYLHPLGVALTPSVDIVPGSVALFGRLDLTLSLWQSTGSLGASERAPPLLLCGSGSIAQAIAGVALLRELTASVVLGVQDDPAHLDDGAECLGGGPVWQSTRWVGARVESRLGSVLVIGFQLGSASHERHTVVSTHLHEGSGAHEHVAEESVHGLEAGAWLSAKL